MTENDFPAQRWRIARRCGPNGGNCVAVNRGIAGVVGIQDTKRCPQSPTLLFDDEQWQRFVNRARGGRFDR